MISLFFFNLKMNIKICCLIDGFLCVTIHRFHNFRILFINIFAFQAGVKKFNDQVFFINNEI